MIIYEYPLGERYRTLLRLDRLFERLALLEQREAAVDHHFYLLTLFEIVELVTRQDLKGELLKELERYRQTLVPLRDNAAVDQKKLEATISLIHDAFSALSQQSTKIALPVIEHDWLSTLRGRLHIAGGSFEFDMPGYYAWQQQPFVQRQYTLRCWSESLQPLRQAVEVILKVARHASLWETHSLDGGYLQIPLSGKNFHLLRVQLPDGELRFPEISGHRLMITIRFMLLDDDFKQRQSTGAITFELSLS